MYQLNLFKTPFALVENHADKTDFHARWNNPAVVAELHREARGRPSFLLHDGPPYANGALHLGHFVNKSVKDAVLKFKRLDGLFAPFVPGFDCHGLPVELEVEKLGHSKADPGAFVAACRSYAEGQVAQQAREFASFGVAADWDRAYRTMDPAFEAGAARAFAGLPQVEQRLRPVHWCPACASSLAEAEVEYKLRASHSLEVLFELVDEPGTYLQVWTTTPYTLPANKGVAFNARQEYVQVADGARKLVRARRPGDAADAPPVALAGRFARSPCTGAAVPVLAADYVTAAGTGLVHLAPSFGLDDFRVGQAHGLPVEDLVDVHGRFRTGKLAGLSLEQASQEVLAGLGELVYSHQHTQHEYPHCWRHKTPLFFKASEEWFLDLAELGPRAAAALHGVTFYPQAGRERLTAMLASRSAWCLSRTRLWGTPLADPAKDDELALLDQVATEGVAAWQQDGPRRTLDVWFDSGMTHELVLRARFGRGADLVVEGSDQHRGWFQSSLLTSVALHGTAPYAAVLTHGFVLDEKGNKYSKSSANYAPLAATLSEVSPDVLRLWVLSQDVTRDLTMGREALQRSGERYRKLRNTLRFCLQNTQDADLVMPGAVTGALHLAQLADLDDLVGAVRAAAERYDFAAVAAQLTAYCEQVSGEYFTAVKDALYCEAPAAPRRREAQAVLSRMLSVLVRLLVPLLPFTAEEAFQQLRTRLPGAPATSLQLAWADLEQGLPAGAPDRAVQALFAQLRPWRRAMHCHVEAARDAFLKGPAQLELAVALPPGTAAREVDLEDFFGCARVTLCEGAQAAVTWQRTALPRCPRCRRHRSLAAGGLCQRCEEAEGGGKAAACKTVDGEHHR